jgi:hypothetical protein
MSSQDSESYPTKSDLPQDKGVVSVDTHAAKLKEGAHTLTARESLSAYFTIAAAAFGLISDGCEWAGVYFYQLLTSCRSEQSYDNVQCLYLRS